MYRFCWRKLCNLNYTFEDAEDGRDRVINNKKPDSNRHRANWSRRKRQQPQYVVRQHEWAVTGGGQPEHWGLAVSDPQQKLAASGKQEQGNLHCSSKGVLGGVELLLVLINFGLEFEQLPIQFGPARKLFLSRGVGTFLADLIRAMTLGFERLGSGRRCYPKIY